MSNILIIKHGSLGDIVQISGVLRDIKETHLNDKIFILTTLPYVELLSTCPFIDKILIDRRLPRWNLIYLLKLKKMIKSCNFSHVYDLQNSPRTFFYKKYLFNFSKWNNKDSILNKDTSLNDIDDDSVLERFKLQLDNSEVSTKYTLKPNFSWATKNIDSIVGSSIKKKYILMFPFCSPKLKHKQWPYYNSLIKLIKSHHLDLDIVIAPGPNEIELAKEINAIVVKNANQPLSIMELADLIKKSSFVIANDTGPAHMTAHLGKKGIVLFGFHTTPKKVSIETENFKSIVADDLKNLTAEYVYNKFKSELI